MTHQLNNFTLRNKEMREVLVYCNDKFTNLPTTVDRRTFSANI